MSELTAPVAAPVKRKRGRPRKVTPPVDVVTESVVLGGGAEPVGEVEPGSRVYEMHDLERRANASMPNPPKCIQARLKRGDMVWRWHADKMAQRLGMRGYETVSPTAEERNAIDRGDCAPGVRVHADNRIMYLDDAFLVAIPRKQYLHRMALKRERVIEQTNISRNSAGLAAQAARYGGKAGFTLQQTIGPMPGE